MDRLRQQRFWRASQQNPPPCVRSPQICACIGPHISIPAAHSSTLDQKGRLGCHAAEGGNCCMGEEEQGAGAALRQAATDGRKVVPAALGRSGASPAICVSKSNHALAFLWMHVYRVIRMYVSVVYAPLK
ncbi:hypothetical protein PVAP13_8NG129600 [Panicum virgatum]|uniref:Uncharacterized protein n=1 Tax=Panicum virgatum TaxID=38727 RepID=A0A8T0PB40_PANVG|nr:hypothetical protein PVAP13_8NG129600 [Panicum virgatum]